MTQHIKPLYISAEMEGKRVNKILVDDGASVSIITVKTVESLGIAKEKVLSSNLKVRSFAEMLMWDPATDKAELVKADDRPYSVASCILDAEYYYGDMRPLGVAGIDTKGRPVGVTSTELTRWGLVQAAFDKIKEYLTHPPVLRPPQPGIPLKLYISASSYSIAGLLAQDDDGEGLRHYMLSFTTVVVAQTDLVRYLLTRPMLRGRIGKWILALSEFSLQYTPLKTLTGHAVSDFLLHHPIIEDIEDQNVVVSFVRTQPWVLYFDGSITDHLSGAGVALVSPSGARHCYSFQLECKCTNNQTEYEAIIIGLELLLDLEVTEVKERTSELLDQFADVVLDYIPRERNFAANELAQLANGIRLADGVCERILKVQRRTLPSFMTRKEVKDEWLYLTDPSAPVDKRVRYYATNNVLRGDELLRRAEDGLYLRCIYGAEAKRWLREVHCGNCGSHQAGPKMRWLIRRYGFYWPTMLKDYISFAQGCIEYGIPECLVADRGACFMAEKTQKFLADYGIKFLHSIPFYAQSNGQAEASNWVIMSILKRMLDANPRSWHTELDHTLWAYRTSKRTPTGTTPYALMYGLDAVLPIEINVQSLRVREQH
ncbi:uncharacterized protein LOC126792269 [Argentina anserina]|uniref:uncharacterized protein LOC126792269 n=1 Tax=Argentina anserina TaxID=57926 RepID=UPI00217640B7|nr:uncharacterized protein LOC126792269 [Potentilla anserina]